MSDPDVTIAENANAVIGPDVIKPDNLAQVARAQDIEATLTPALERLAADRSSPLAPADVARLAQGLGQALAQDPGFFSQFKKRLGAVDYTMISGVATGVVALVDLIAAGGSTVGIMAAVYTALTNGVPLAKTIAPRFGMWLENFTRRHP